MMRRLIWLVPVVVLLLFSAYGLFHGTSGMWHSQCLEFWQKEKWHELKALAGNLDTTNRADAETLYFAAHASLLLQDPASVTHFASRFLRERSLNWNWELWLAKNYQPQGPLERLRLYRTRAIILILAMVSLLNVLCLWRNWNTLFWSAIISIAGIIVFIV